MWSVDPENISRGGWVHGVILFSDFSGGDGEVGSKANFPENNHVNLINLEFFLFFLLGGGGVWTAPDTPLDPPMYKEQAI